MDAGASPSSSRRPSLRSLRGASTGSLRSRGDPGFGPLGHAEWSTPPGSAAAAAGASQGLCEETCGPPVIRHNACFLHPKGLDDGTGFAPTRPLLMGCRYHDMVRETIYMAGSRDVERLGRHLASLPEREAEQMEWSKNRFRKQRETAQLWQDMRGTFDSITGRPQGARPSTSEPEAAPPPAGSGAAAQRAGDSAASSAPGGRSGTGSRGSIAGRVLEELSSMGLADPAGSFGDGRLGQPRGCHRTASEPSLATLCVSKGGLVGSKTVVRQAPGTRGLPKGFKPAVAMHTGVMMFPKDRCYVDNRELL